MKRLILLAPASSAPLLLSPAITTAGATAGGWQIPGASREATVEAIHEQGGIGVAAHPLWRTERQAGRFPHGVGERLGAGRFDAVEVLNGAYTPSMVRANAEAVRANESLGLAAIGGSDAHVKQAVGWAHTLFPGSTAADLRVAILSHATAVEGRHLSLIGLSRYLAWGVERLRIRPAIA